MKAAEDDLSFNSLASPVLEIKSNGRNSIFDHSEDNSDESDVLLVGFDKDGDLDPRQWSNLYRHYITAFMIIFITVTSIASSVQSAFASDLSAELKLTSQTVTVLLITHYDICYCVGPLIWGPLSEQYGRKPILLLCLNGMAAFQMGAALSQSVAAIASLRFLAGLFASVCLPLSAAMVADIWEAELFDRALGSYVISSTLFPGGAAFGALMGKANFGWRGTFWVLAITSGVLALLVALTVAETHRPTVLVIQARRLRKETHDHRYRAPLELSYEPGHSSRGRSQKLAQPFTLLAHEPILVLSSIYMVLVLGCLNVYFEASVLAAQHYSPAFTSYLSSPAIIVGAIFGTIIYQSVIRRRLYQSKVRAAGALERTPPERRLILAIWVGPLFAISFFWFGWTLLPGISVAAPVASAIPLGMSSFWLTFAMFGYVIDVYEDVAATALACCIAVSSVFIAISPLVSARMFEVMGLHWASTLAGCVATVSMAIPIALVRYGPAMRARSQYIQ